MKHIGEKLVLQCPRIRECFNFSVMLCHSLLLNVHATREYARTSLRTLWDLKALVYTVSRRELYISMSRRRWYTFSA